MTQRYKMETKYTFGGGLLRVERRLNGKLHGGYAPAIEIYSTNGYATFEYYINGIKGNHFGPAVRVVCLGMTQSAENWIDGRRID